MYSRVHPLGLIKAAVRESVKSIRDPHRAGASVALVAEATGESALKSLLQQMKGDAEGQTVLEARPLFTRQALEEAKLHSLPANTLGGAFYQYMAMHGFELGERPKVKLIDDPDLAYVMQRYRDTHDMLHAISGVPISVSGEIALKFFEMTQTGLPMTALAAFVGPLRAEPSSDPSLLLRYINWSCRAARKSNLFLNFYFETRWSQDLVDFRREMGIPALPDNLPSLDACWDPHRIPLLRQHYEEAIKALETDPNGKEKKEPFETYLKNLSKL